MYQTIINTKLFMPQKACVIMGRSKNNTKETNKTEKREFDFKAWAKKKKTPIAVICTFLGTSMIYISGGFFENIGANMSQGFLGFIALPGQVAQINESISTLQTNVTEEFDNVKEEIETLKTEDISPIKEDIKELRKDIGVLQTNYSTLQTEVNLLKNDVNILKEGILSSALMNLSATDELEIYETSVQMQYCLAAPKWTATDIIAKDIANDKEYTAAELVNMPLLMTYVQNGQEVFFYGQFNENNQWDKNCIINIYENNKLVLIMDAVYEDGKLLEYKQVLPYNTGKDKPAWIVSNRKAQEKYNSGDSWSYLRTKEYIKDFTLEGVRDKNILSVDQFVNSLDEVLEGFYHGNTSDGKYNDDTGNAYLVKYNENRDVTLLYQGMFKDGKFEDTTGNAWYIVKEPDTEYMYYKGHFSGGNTLNDANHKFVNPVSPSEIEEILKGKEFHCIIQWETNN